MRKRLFQYRSLLLLTVVCLGLFSLSAHAAADVPGKVLRVAYPIQKGLTEKGEDGTYRGYTYEYLLEIAKYTGWEYEIVTPDGCPDTQAQCALEMLEDGEVDLLGGLNYNTALSETFTYPGQAYGTNYMGIFVPYDSPLSETTLYTTKKIRVAVYQKNGLPNPKLEQFAQMNNLPLEQVMLDSLAELSGAVANGRADAILSTDLAVGQHGELHAIARFSPTPFYFATGKGNVDIARQLDYALSTIMQVTPDFETELIRKYFSTSPSKLRLTDDEKAFIADAPIQKVLVYGNRPPFFYTDKSTGRYAGIFVAYFERITEMTGLQFSFQPVSSYAEYLDQLNSGSIDLSAHKLLQSQSLSETKMTATLPWHTLPIYMAVRANAPYVGEGRGVMPYSLLDAFPVSEEMRYFDTPEQCLQAVQSGVADYAYLDEFSGQYLLGSGLYNDLRLMSNQQFNPQQACFGIVNNDSLNFHLLSILNKSISFMPADELEELVYKNTYRQQPFPFSTWLQRHLALIFFSVMVLTILSLSVYIKQKDHRQRQIAFENKRYQMISALSNEFFYEYQTETDQLILPERCAHYFSCDTVIDQFACRLAKLDVEARVGIWQLGELLVKSTEGQHELVCRMMDGSHQWFRVICASLSDEKERTHAIGKIVDIQNAKNEQLRLEQKAQLDGLTGIYNVAAIRQFVESRLEQFERCAPCAFIVLDIDNFKQINDCFGHYTGDAVLIRIAKLIGICFPSCLTGRLGGDEFIIFAQQVTVDDIRRKCAHLCALARQKDPGTADLSVSLSVGVTIANRLKSYAALYQEADSALYRIKNSTKDGFLIFEPGTTP